MTRATGGAVNYRQVLRNRNFLALWMGQLVSQVGDFFYYLAVFIVVNDLTGSTFQVGLAALATAIPRVFLGPIAGVFVDRWDRKRTMIVADLLRGGLVLLSFLVTSTDDVWILYLAGFTLSVGSVFFIPAQRATLPRIVPSEHLLSANAMLQITQTGAMLFGSALAGVLIGLIGPGVAFGVNSASFFLSALCILAVAVPPRAPDEAPTDGSLRQVADDLIDGLRVIAGSRTVLGLLVLISMVQLGLGAINVLWVPYLTGHFGAGPEVLGFIDSAQGAGMLLGGAAMGVLARRFTKSQLTNGGVAIVGLGVAAIGLAPNYWAVLWLTLSLGVALTPAISSLETILQIVLPDAKLGRVYATIGALGGAAGLFSMAGAAALADSIGIPQVYVLGGLLVAGSGVAGIFLIEEPAPSVAEAGKKIETVVTEGQVT